MLIHLTIGEIITSLIMYTILHGIVWVGRHIEQFAANEYHRILISHTKSGHKGRLDNCQHCPTGKSLPALVVSAEMQS